MRYGLAFLIILFPLHSHGCFSGVGYEQNWHDSVSLLLVSLVIGFIATFVRYIQKAKRLYIPLTILAIACIPSIIEILRYGNGDCGAGLMEVSVWPVYIIFTVLFYETVKLVKVKFGVGNV
ncbi:hypothetical protein [Paraglaciecola sp. 2405UD69-4]|uniref:hypothetical protein n=1 Tax=Paraglaciecola sp. 2405UD69-4 TaxID=3391836 RepID=UPI0039C9EA8F